MNIRFCILLLVVLVLGCKRESDLPPLHPDEFTHSQREQLGSYLSQAVISDGQVFDIRFSTSPKDSSLYGYLQWQYDQAAYFYHFDNTSSNSWNPNLQWKVYIVKDETPMAITFPGGDHFISEGMLAQLEGADQLFALFALELTRMEHRFLFYKLIERFGTNRVLEMVEDGQTKNGISRMDFVEEILSTSYDPEILQRLDLLAVEHICRSSIFSPSAMDDLENLFRNRGLEWVARKSYAGRSGYLINVLETSSEGCGDRGDQGDYQKNVLDNL